MKADSLIQFLKREISAKIFADEITEEIETYRQSLNKLGSSVPIQLTGNGELTIGYSELTILLNAFIEGSLDEYALRYICDVLDLHENIDFKNEFVRDNISSISEPDINDTIDRKSVEILCL